MLVKIFVSADMFCLTVRMHCSINKSRAPHERTIPNERRTTVMKHYNQDLLPKWVQPIRCAVGDTVIKRKMTANVSAEAAAELAVTGES